uniref:Uncharacterized protein n=1 Tax=Arundo donax TaxID=35708 RepID=A0A0A9ENR9_ARUDO
MWSEVQIMYGIPVMRTHEPMTKDTWNSDVKSNLGT